MNLFEIGEQPTPLAGWQLVQQTVRTWLDA
jgi:hypothetical protein